MSRALAVLIRRARSGYVLGVESGPLPCSSAEDQRCAIDELEARLMKRRVTEGKSPARAPHADALDMLEKWPLLGAWFTDPAYEDGQIRQAGWMSITARLGHFRATLKEASEAVMLELAAPSFLTLLDLAEGALCDPGTVWLADPKPFIPASQRPKKGS